MHDHDLHVVFASMQAPFDLHALRDAFDMPIPHRVSGRVYFHARYPARRITEYPERPPCRHFHRATAGAALPDANPAIVGQKVGPALDFRCDPEHILHRGVYGDAVNRPHRSPAPPPRAGSPDVDAPWPAGPP